MNRPLLLLGSLFAFFGVALGAFGAHGLRTILSPEYLLVFETAVRYHMYHSLAILFCAVAAGPLPAAVTAGRLFGLGILLFSGSLYALTMTGISWFGMITPLGGVSFLAGWGWLFAAAFKMNKES